MHILEKPDRHRIGSSKPPERIADNWHILSANSTGGMHTARQKPCQDRFLMIRTDTRIILLIADGHSPDEYCRAEIGAELACNSAGEILSAPGIHYPNVHIAIKKLFDEKVADHLARNPLTEVEINLLGEPPSYVYGTTLSCVMITPEGVYRFQLGDSAIHVLDGTGKFLPDLPEDPSSYFGYVSSLVSEDAALNARWDFTPGPVGAVIMHSDGYEPGGSRPWGLLSLLKDASAQTIPRETLDRGRVGDDQTVLMAINRNMVDTDAFLAGFDLEKHRQILLERTEVLESYLKDVDSHISLLTEKLATCKKPPERSKLIEQLSERQHAYITLAEEIKRTRQAAADHLILK